MKLHIKESMENHCAEIVGKRNYDGSFAFIVHSPVFDDYGYVNKLRRVMPEYEITTTGFSDEVAVFADPSELSDIQKYIKRFNDKYISSVHESFTEKCTYRVWYNPYLLEPDEEDFVDIEAESEDEARRRAGSYGYVTDIEVRECNDLGESIKEEENLYSDQDILDALQDFMHYNSNKGLDRIKKRIARKGEFDNGYVMHGDWQKMSVLDAERLAQQKSIENPGKTYYVSYDDIMVGASDIQWKDGQLQSY